MKFHFLGPGGNECNGDQKAEHERDNPGDCPAAGFAYVRKNQAGGHNDIALRRQHADRITAIIDSDPEVNPSKKDKEHGCQKPPAASGDDLCRSQQYFKADTNKGHRADLQHKADFGTGEPDKGIIIIRQVLQGQVRVRVFFIVSGCYEDSLRIFPFTAGCCGHSLRIFPFTSGWCGDSLRIFPFTAGCCEDSFRSLFNRMPLKLRLCPRIRVHQFSLAEWTACLSPSDLYHTIRTILHLFFSYTYII